MTDLPRLLLLTDRSQLPPDRWLVETVAACVGAGLTHVVLRELDLPTSVRTDLVEALGDAGATVLAAHESLVGSVGVHLSAVGAPVDVPWGRSCHSADDIARAAADGACWVTLSPFAGSASKPGHGPALPASAFAGHPVPVFALGGIDPGNAGDAVAAGAHGVAVMGAVMRAEDPAAVVRDLLVAVA